MSLPREVTETMYIVHVHVLVPNTWIIWNTGDFQSTKEHIYTCTCTCNSAYPLITARMVSLKGTGTPTTHVH